MTIYSVTLQTRAIMVADVSVAAENVTLSNAVRILTDDPAPRITVDRTIESLDQLSEN